MSSGHCFKCGKLGVTYTECCADETAEQVLDLVAIPGTLYVSGTCGSCYRDYNIQINWGTTTISCDCGHEIHRFQPEKTAYLAAPWGFRVEIRRRMDQIAELGYGWHGGNDWTAGEDSDLPEKSEQYSIEDIEGARDCDLFVLNLYEGAETNGAWIETGVRIAVDKPVHVVLEGFDPETVIFLAHPLCVFYEDWEDFLAYLHRCEKRSTGDAA